MNLAASILGQTAVTRLEETAKTAVLEIGTDKITRAQLANVECYNFHAARMLTHILRDMKVRSLRQVYDEIPPAQLAVPGMGVVSLAVLGAAFEAKGIGGETPLEAYVSKHARANGTGKIVTFDTLKDREAKERRDEAREHKRRKRQRRDQAHATRVERFLDNKEG